MSRLRKVGIGTAVLVGFVLLLAGGAIGFAAATGESKLSFADTPAPTITASTDPEVIERGRYLVRGPAHCAACHSSDDRSSPEKVLTAPLSGGLSFDMGPMGTRYARNLTPDRETGIGRYTDAEIARTIRTGVLPSGELSIFMLLAAADLSDDDVTAVLSYLRSIEPVRHAVEPGTWTLFAKVMLTYLFPPMEPRAVAGPRHVPAGEEPSLARGEYLAENVMLCGLCHTAMDPNTLQIVGPRFGGSLPEANHYEEGDMEFVAPNLTSHPTGVTGKLTEDQFVARLRAGRVHRYSSMPWENFGIVTENDLRSVYRYLRSVPPVDADVGPTYRKIGWTPQ
jgi:mono/diheme cytochrome c family protein